MAYADTNLTIEQVEHLITRIDEFNVRQHIVVPNVSWGFLNHEADLLVLSRDNYLTEIEIKRAWQDFKKDFTKDHTHEDSRLTYFYYAVPEKIVPAVKQVLYKTEPYKDWHGITKEKVVGYTDKNPNHCGLIVYGELRGYDHVDEKSLDYYYARIEIPAERLKGEKVEFKDKMQLMRLGLMRVWKAKEKIASLQAELQGSILRF
jgi:hypothetical protein